MLMEAEDYATDVTISTKIEILRYESGNENGDYGRFYRGIYDTTYILSRNVRVNKVYCFYLSIFIQSLFSNTFIIYKFIIL